MSKQAESRLSGEILKALRERGYFAYKVHGGPTTMSGLPDIIACVEGLFVGIETKMPAKRGNVSEIQKLRHEQIRAAGGVAEVVCGVKEAQALIGRALATERVPTFSGQAKGQSDFSTLRLAIESLRSHRMEDLPHTRDERVLGRREGEDNAFAMVLDLLSGNL